MQLMPVMGFLTIDRKLLDSDRLIFCVKNWDGKNVGLEWYFSAIPQLSMGHVFRKRIKVFVQLDEKTPPRSTNCYPLSCHSYSSSLSLSRFLLHFCLTSNITCCSFISCDSPKHFSSGSKFNSEKAANWRFLFYFPAFIVFSEFWDQDKI